MKSIALLVVLGRSSCCPVFRGTVPYDVLIPETRKIQQSTSGCTPFTWYCSSLPLFTCRSIQHQTECLTVFFVILGDTEDVTTPSTSSCNVSEKQSSATKVSVDSESL